MASFYLLDCCNWGIILEIKLLETGISKSISGRINL
jgi:hypothetical protein